MADKPRTIELLEKFIRAENKVGVSRETIIEQLTDAVNFFIDDELTPDLNALERAAVNKIGPALIDKSVSRYVNKVLDS